MGRVRRGGYIIEWWIGDHYPKHVHVYRDGREVAKVQVPGLIVLGGKNMKTEKLKSVSFSNKTKQICVSYISGKTVTFHYGQVGIKKNIAQAWVDQETRRRSIGFEFADGSEEFMPYDQPLAISRDPEFLLQTHMELLTAKIKAELKDQGISKRFLATRLGTSDNQIQRLLNPAILNKNLEQLYGIAALLGLEFEIRLRSAS